MTWDIILRAAFVIKNYALNDVNPQVLCDRQRIAGKCGLPGESYIYLELQRNLEFLAQTAGDFFVAFSPCLISDFATTHLPVPLTRPLTNEADRA
jgi:hypothetical protein